MSLLKISKETECPKFRITNKDNSLAEIVIYSEIGQNFWGDGVSAQSFSDELKALPTSVKKINLRLNSPGGNVFDGLTIYNRLKQHSAKITVYVDGLAASIASIIAMAGDEIIMGEGALMMIHKPMTYVYGNAQEMEEMILRLDDVEEQLVGIYKRKTGLDRSEIKSLMAKETWLNSTEAFDMKFATALMEEEEEVKIAASFDNCPWMKNKQLSISNGAYIRKQIDKFKQDAKALLTR